MKTFTSKIYAAVALALIVGFVAGAFWLLSLKNQNREFAPGLQGDTQPQDSAASVDTSNWKTYRNEQYGFEVKYPEDLTPQNKPSAGFISWDGELEGVDYTLALGHTSQNSLNAMGITYCEANPKDARCENFKWGSLEATIDWDIEEEEDQYLKHASAIILLPNGGAITFDSFYPPTLKVREVLLQILSTFKFIK